MQDLHQKYAQTLLLPFLLLRKTQPQPQTPTSMMWENIIDFGTRHGRQSCHLEQGRGRWPVAWHAWHVDLAPCASKAYLPGDLWWVGGGEGGFEAISRVLYIWKKPPQTPLPQGLVVGLLDILFLARDGDASAGAEPRMGLVIAWTV